MLPMIRRRIPAVTPAVSIITSRKLGPRSGTKRWMVSSPQATRNPQGNAHRQGFCAIANRQASKPPKQANSVKCANFRSRPCPASGSSGPLGKSIANRSRTQPLNAPEASPGSKELPQIKAILHIRRAVQSWILFCVCFITERPNAPAGSSRQGR